MAREPTKTKNGDVPGQGMLFETGLPENPDPAAKVIKQRKLPKEKERLPYAGFEIPLDPLEPLPTRVLRSKKERVPSQAASPHEPLSELATPPGIKRGPFLCKSFGELKSRFMPASRLHTEALWDRTTTSVPMRVARGDAQLEFFELRFSEPRDRPSRWVLEAPTNSGKSYIGLILIEHALQFCARTPGAPIQKPVIITPDKDLVEQLVKDARTILGISRDEIGVSGRAAGPERRRKLWNDPSKLFHIYTPGTFWNDVNSGLIKPEQIKHQAVLDETHHYFDGLPKKPDPEFKPTELGIIYARCVEFLAEHDINVTAMSATPGPAGSAQIDALRSALGKARYFPINLPDHKVSHSHRVLDLDGFHDPRHDHKLVWAANRLLTGARDSYSHVQHFLAKLKTEEASELSDRLARMCTIRLMQPPDEQELKEKKPYKQDLMLIDREIKAQDVNYFVMPSQGVCLKFCHDIGRLEPSPELKHHRGTVIKSAWRIEHYRRWHAQLTGAGIATSMRDWAENILEVKFGLDPRKFGKKVEPPYKGPSQSKIDLFESSHASMGNSTELSPVVSVFRFFASGAPRLDNYNKPLRGEDGKVSDQIVRHRYMDLIQFATFDDLRLARYPELSGESAEAVALRFLNDAQQEFVHEGTSLKDHPKTESALKYVRSYDRSGYVGKGMIKTNFVRHGYFLEQYIPHALKQMGVSNFELSFIEGGMSNNKRAEILEKFHRPCAENGKTKILVVCKLANEGRHDPEVDFVLCMQPQWNAKGNKQLGGRTNRSTETRKPYWITSAEEFPIGHVRTYSMGPGSEDFRRLHAGLSQLRKFQREYEAYRRIALAELEQYRQEVLGIGV